MKKISAVALLVIGMSAPALAQTPADLKNFRHAPAVHDSMTVKMDRHEMTGEKAAGEKGTKGKKKHRKAAHKAKKHHSKHEAAPAAAPEAAPAAKKEEGKKH